jgi:hypothetical protein
VKPNTSIVFTNWLAEFLSIFIVTSDLNFPSITQLLLIDYLIVAGACLMTFLFELCFSDWFFFAGACLNPGHTPRLLREEIDLGSN